MQRLLQYLERPNLFETLPLHSIIQNFSKIPSQIIDKIKLNPQIFKAYIKNNKNCNMTHMQKLALINQIIIHSEQFYEQFSQLDFNHRCQDPWLNNAIYIPFANFLRKIIHSQEMYEKVRVINLCWNKLFKSQNSHKYKTLVNRNPKEYINLKLIYYIVNLINDLFETLKSIHTLGRYYLLSNRAQVEPFVQIACIQAVSLYFALKFIIEEILLDFDYYIISKAEGEAFKEILFDDLQLINQKMKQALLSKYFVLNEKGIKIQLFQIDKQRQFFHGQIFKLVEEYGNKKTKINVIRTQMKILQEKIFGETKFDNRLFEQSTTLFTKRKFNQQTTEDCDQKQNNSLAVNILQIQQKKPTTRNKSKRGSHKSKEIMNKLVRFLTNENETDL